MSTERIAPSADPMSTIPKERTAQPSGEALSPVAFAAALATGIVASSVAIARLSLSFTSAAVAIAAVIVVSTSTPEAVAATSVACAIALSIAHAPWLWVAAYFSSLFIFTHASKSATKRLADALKTPVQLSSATCAIGGVASSGCCALLSTTKRIVYSVFGKHSAPAPVSPMPDLVASPVACDRASAQSPNTSTSRAQLNACSPSVQGRPSIVEEGEYCTS